MAHKNILARKFCQDEITERALQNKRLLTTYTFYLATETAKCSQTQAVCYTLQSEKAHMHENHFQLIMPFTMDVNAGHVNSYI